jgi:hypothetical protein
MVVLGGAAGMGIGFARRPVRKRRAIGATTRAKQASETSRRNQLISLKPLDSIGARHGGSLARWRGLTRNPDNRSVLSF